MKNRAAARAAAASMERALPLLNSTSSTFDAELERYQAALMAEARRMRRRNLWISGIGLVHPPEVPRGYQGP